MKTRKTADQDLSYRSISIRAGEPSTLDEDKRSVEITLATENPALVFDFNRFEVVWEVLIIAGCEFPKSRQIPMLDVHSRFSLGSVLGSIRDLKKQGAELVGRAVFSSAESVSETWTKIREGHLTDFSAGYKSIDSQWVPEKETYEYRGVTYKGPILVTKKWKIREGSVVPIGADELATARTANKVKSTNKEADSMNEKTRKYLIKRGLAEDATEDEAWAFLETLEARVMADIEFEGKGGENAEVDVDAIRTAAVGEERIRIDEIVAMGTRFDTMDIAKEHIKKGSSVADAKIAVADKIMQRELAKKQPGHMSPATIIEDATDKFRAAATDSLILRSAIAPVEKPAPGADELLGFSLKELARESLRMAGERHTGNAVEMVGRALTIGDLPYILANVANKALFNGWDSAGESWSTWCGTGSVADFKTNYLPRASEFSDLDEVPEHGEYLHGKITEAQESYSVVTYGKLFAITRQTIINDDLGALTSEPARMGEAAARKVGDVAYAVLTANAAMGDAIALFHASHSNFIDNGSGAVPGQATIAAGILAMGTQTDLQGLRRLNIRPVFTLMPKALEGAAEVFFNSGSFSDHSTVATDSSFASSRWNPYAGNYFTRVYDSRLDDDDAAAWYLAAKKGSTVNVYFLNGVQKPYTEQRMGWTVDGTEFKVRIDCGAKAVDWKGLYFNDGN